MLSACVSHVRPSFSYAVIYGGRLANKIIIYLNIMKEKFMEYVKLLKKQGMFSTKQRKKEIEEHLLKIKKLRKEKFLMKILSD